MPEGVEHGTSCFIPMEGPKHRETRGVNMNPKRRTHSRRSGPTAALMIRLVVPVVLLGIFRLSCISRTVPIAVVNGAR